MACLNGKWYASLFLASMQGKLRWFNSRFLEQRGLITLALWRCTNAVLVTEFSLPISGRPKFSKCVQVQNDLLFANYLNIENAGLSISWPSFSWRFLLNIQLYPWSLSSSAQWFHDATHNGSSCNRMSRPLCPFSYFGTPFAAGPPRFFDSLGRTATHEQCVPSFVIYCWRNWPSAL